MSKYKLPKLNNPMSELDLIRAFNYNSIYGTDIRDKRHVKNYLDVFVPSDETKNMKSVNEYEVDSSIATLAHLVTEGYELPEDAKTKLDKGINFFIKNHQKKPKPKPVEKKSAVKKLTVKDFSTEAIGDMEYEIDQMLDNNVQTDFSVYNYLKGKQYKQNVCNAIKRWFKPQLLELEYSLTTDKEYKDYRDSYAYMTKPQRKRYKKFLDSIISDCDKYTKERRKPRRKKRKKVSTQKSLDTNLQKFLP